MDTINKLKEVMHSCLNEFGFGPLSHDLGKQLNAVLSPLLPLGSILNSVLKTII